MASIALPSAFTAELRATLRDRLQAMALRRFDADDAPRAAVLVPLCHVGGKPSVLFTKRTETVGTHKGQVSFPGGRMDPEDADEVACALRELEEELGLARSHVEVLGVFHDIRSITGMRVTPVVGFIEHLPPLRDLPVSRMEIEEVFTLSLEQLVDEAQRKPMTLGKRTVASFTAGPWPVWGLTAFILDELLRDALDLPLPLFEHTS
jgi:8-oxo-dGTP pyrophosphatase MutT (NUDIX family)